MGKNNLTNFGKLLYYNCLKRSLRLSSTPSKKAVDFETVQLCEGNIAFCSIYFILRGVLISRQFLTLYLQKTKAEKNYSPYFFEEQE